MERLLTERCRDYARGGCSIECGIDPRGDCSNGSVADVDRKPATGNVGVVATDPGWQIGQSPPCCAP